MKNQTFRVLPDNERGRKLAAALRRKSLGRITMADMQALSRVLPKHKQCAVFVHTKMAALEKSVLAALENDHRVSCLVLLHSEIQPPASFNAHRRLRCVAHAGLRAVSGYAVLPGALHILLKERRL